MDTIPYVGIDNGTSGALAALMGNEVVLLERMPVVEIGKDTFIDETALAEMLGRFPGSQVVFEQGQKNPLFGTKGNFANGYSFGVVQTVLRLGRHTYTNVNPRTWQKDVFKDMRGTGGGDTKGASLEFCRRTFPQVNLIPKGCRKEHDGLADALCMAWWAKNYQFKY